MTRRASESLAIDDTVTGAGRRRRLTKGVLVAAGVLLTVVGVGVLGLVYRISEVDTYSVTVVLSEDRMDTEALSKFRFTSWQEPAGNVRPFAHGPKSFQNCEILRYRTGTRSRSLARQTYYEAEYRMPGGSLVIGPAFGPRPYTAPNLFLLGPVILAGVVMLVAGIALRPVKATETEACG